MKKVFTIFKQIDFEPIVYLTLNLSSYFTAFILSQNEHILNHCAYHKEKTKQPVTCAQTPNTTHCRNPLHSSLKVKHQDINQVEGNISVWQGVAMDSLKFHPGPACLTFLRPAGGPQGWSTHRVGSLWPSFTPLYTPRRTPMAEGKRKSQKRQSVAAECH
jgi:hypothetical protein